MKVRLLPLSLCFASLVFLQSCGSLKEPDFKGIENVRISKLGLNASNFKLDLLYYNPNKARLKLKWAEGDAWLENTHLGHFTIDTLVQIPAKEDFRLPVTLEADMSKMLKNTLIALLAKEVTIRIEGTARLGKGPIFINYPIKYEGKQKLDELLK